MALDPMPPLTDPVQIEKVARLLSPPGIEDRMAELVEDDAEEGAA